MLELTRDQSIASKTAGIRHHGLLVGSIDFGVTGGAGLTSRFGISAYRLRGNLDGQCGGKKQAATNGLAQVVHKTLFERRSISARFSFAERERHSRRP